ncbi:RICIN domain-containing protein [Streptomyces globisporus]|uniref:RICIN domain-containing protein n=1 Tax=Streptomyces albovinaceus subgroup TaxID=1482558 RepID=UPI000A3BDE69|nr:RICIN domain-containing protein [Streptomyces albovinaceus]
MPGTPGDPGSALAPGGGERPGGKAAPASGTAPETATRAESPASGTSAKTNADANTNAATGPDAAKTGEATGTRANAPRGEAESTAEPAAPAAALSGAASASASSASVPTAELATVSTDGPASGTVATATGTGGGGGASSQEGDEPPGSRPKKPMLAAAGIVGALLIAVPFLLAGQDDREPERTRTENAAGTVLDSERPPVPETYTSQSPAPSPTPSKKEKKEKKEKKPVEPVIHQQPVTPSPTPSPEKSEAAKKPKVKAKVLTPAEKLRQWANGRSGVQNTVIKNADTGQCVDVPGWGKGEVDSRINQDPCTTSTSDNQLWNLDIVDKDGGPQNAPLFLIRNSKGGLCLDLGYYGARSAGTKVTQFHCNATGDNQLWWLDPRGDGTNWIRNAVSNDLCLRPTGGASAKDDTALEIANCGFGDRWIV